MAILAIALHGLLLGLAPLAASAADPLAVICHSGTPSGEDQSPASPDIAAHGCEHCNLCSAAAAPATPGDVVAGRLVPARALEIPPPASTAATTNLATTPKLAQGPPSFA